MYTHRQSNRGFTLVEVLIATILVGLSIYALLAANGAFSMVNGAGVDLTTAEFLAEQIRERTTVLPVVDPQNGTGTFGLEETNIVNADDLDDYDGQSFSPPIDAGGNVLTDFTGFTQQVTVENVNKNNFSQVVTDHSSAFVRVTVNINQNNKTVTTAQWLRARY
jgi:prepilin-type N-terminal cleavage/methylation domain-containing protein